MAKVPLPLSRLLPGEQAGRTQEPEPAQRLWVAAPQLGSQGASQVQKQA